jgi:hypothetical protein
MSCGISIFRRGCIFRSNLLHAVFHTKEGYQPMANQTSTSSYREVKIGNTLYRVTSVFTGEKDLGKTLEQLAVRRAMTELSSCPAT